MNSPKPEGWQWPELTTTAGTSPRVSARRRSGCVGTLAGGVVGVRAVHRPLCAAFIDAAMARGWQLPPASHGRADPGDRELCGIAHQVVRRLLHRRLCPRYRRRPSSSPRGWTPGPGGCHGWTAAWSTRSISRRCSSSRPRRCATMRSPAARYVAVPIDLRQDWPKALRDAGFDAASDGVGRRRLAALSARRRPGPAVRAHPELSAPGSRVAVESFGAGFFDPRVSGEPARTVAPLARRGGRRRRRGRPRRRGPVVHRGPHRRRRVADGARLAR